MAAEQFGPGASIGNTAQWIGLPDPDPVVDDQDPQFVVYGDVHLDSAGTSVTSSVGQGLFEDGFGFELHL